MDQSLLNWILGGMNALLMFLLNSIWNSIKDLQKEDKQLATDLAEIKILVAGEYMSKDDFDRSVKALFNKLDRIEEKLDKKVDK